jgi:hypothetical protein
VKRSLSDLADRLQLIAKRIELVGLVRAAEDLRRIADELHELAARPTAAPRPADRQ